MRVTQIRQIVRGSTPVMFELVMTIIEKDMTRPMDHANRLGSGDTHSGARPRTRRPPTKPLGL
jgi:hypothetical protein